MADEGRIVSDKCLADGAEHLVFQQSSRDVGQRDDGQKHGYHAQPKLAAQHQGDNEQRHHHGFANQAIVAQAADSQLAHALGQQMLAGGVAFHIRAGYIADDDQVQRLVSALLVSAVFAPALLGQQDRFDALIVCHAAVHEPEAFFDVRGDVGTL